MLKHLTSRPRFFLDWIVYNIAGFVVGSLIGATDHSLVAAVLGDSIGARVLGDLVFGGMFGLAQYLVLRRHFPQSSGFSLILWIAASATGFAVGARLGARFVPLIAPEMPGIAIVFGIVIGGSLGIAEWFCMQVLGILKTRNALVWIPVTIVAWIVGEIIAFSAQFSQVAVPFVALAIALVTGVALVVWVRPE